MKKIRLYLLVLLSLLCNDVLAQLIVNTSIAVFDDPNVTRKDITVMNGSSEETLYVKVEPYRVSRPGSDNQDMEPLAPDASTQFLVTPNKLIIPPNGRSVVRMLNLREKNAEEIIYRVNFIPVQPPAELELSQNEVTKSRLDIVVAYQVLVIDMPNQASSSVEFARQAKAASFSNSGNTNFLLVDGKQCDPVNPEDCVTLPDRRIYAGNSWTSELPFDGPFTYTVRNEQGNIPRYFD